MPQLHYVIRGVARGQPRCNRPPRLPITVDILQRLLQFWVLSPARYEAVMLWAACTLGFFGFLHSGEFTVVPDGNQALLSPSDIQVDSCQDPTYVAITLRGSKTDPFSVECTLFIGRTNSSICPVIALLAYLAIRPPSPGQLFIHNDGSPLTRSGLVSAVRAALLRTGVDVTRYTGHSFRIGAATAAAQAGLLDSMIQTLGRWRSSAFQRYIRTPASTLLSISHTLVYARATQQGPAEPALSMSEHM